MAVVNWRAILGWTDEQLEELRFTGFSFLREGHYKKSLLFFEALVILDPLSVYDTQMLGALYLQMGNGKKAVETLDHALTLDPLHEPTILNKVKALLTIGQKVEALELAKTLEKSEDPTIANDAAALLAAYH